MKKRRKTENVIFKARQQQKADYERVSDAQDKSLSEWLRELADMAVREFDQRNNDRG